MERPDRAWCREFGLHLPRTIAAHPTNPMMTLETCLRCGCVLHRSRLTGKEVEMGKYRIGADRVTVGI